MEGATRAPATGTPGWPRSPPPGAACPGALASVMTRRPGCGPAVGAAGRPHAYRAQGDGAFHRRARRYDRRWRRATTATRRCETGRRAAAPRAPFRSAHGLRRRAPPAPSHAAARAGRAAAVAAVMRRPRSRSDPSPPPLHHRSLDARSRLLSELPPPRPALKSSSASWRRRGGHVVFAQAPGARHVPRRRRPRQARLRS